ALGVPTIAIFGSTDPGLTAPLGRSVRVVREKVECSPCFKRECPYGHYKCLRGIDSARVADEAEEMLREP
ncbi:MAG: glycosyltransferase family 9 protein, partial [Thermodesulfobacteriota bacterium]